MMEAHFSPEAGRAVPQISIVICTFERPVLLAGAIRSVLRLDGLDRTALDIVIVDNSDSGSARAVIEDLASTAAAPITYAVSHPPNISLARNAGVAAARAPVIAFLDDDQEVEPGWLSAVLDGLARFPHDVFFGPIAPRFEDGAVASPEARAMFTRHIAAAAGTEVRAFGPRHGDRFALATANSIFRRRATLDEPAPFDPAFGQAGGEDFHLFCRLQHGGRRFAWLPDAAATDFVPRHRCDPAYLERRHYAGGQAFAAALVKTSPHPGLTGAVILAKALLQAALLAPRSLAALARRKKAPEALAFRRAGIMGKLFWTRLHPLYREEERLYAAPARSAS